ncbi:MAG: 50S ribosomal protein L27 [Bacteroidota bacterium]
MAHKKGVGSTDNGRDSKSKRLGVKLFGGQYARAGNIIIRQRGTKYHAGENTYLGKDFTLHAAVDGTVAFRRRRQNRVYVSIVPDTQELPTRNTSPKVSDKELKDSTIPVEDAVVVDAGAGGINPVMDIEDVVAEATVVDVATEEEVASNPAVVEEEASVPVMAATPVVEEELKAVEEQVEEAKDNEEPPAIEPVEELKKDKLTKIEGIGPKIQSLLYEAGILTFVALSGTEPEKIREILLAAGNRYKMHNPTTWPKQAALAAAGQWDELKEYQDKLDGGKEVA